MNNKLSLKAGKKIATAIVVQRISQIAHIPPDRQFRKWALAALASVGKRAELTVRVVNAAEARNLNSAFRGKDYAPNVLTFVYHEQEATTLMGDLVLCAPVVAREARAQQKALQDHYAHITVHGVLHLAGFDHEQSCDAAMMEATEANILAAFGIANPYLDLTDCS